MRNCYCLTSPSHNALTTVKMGHRFGVYYSSIFMATTSGIEELDIIAALLKVLIVIKTTFV